MHEANHERQAQETPQDLNQEPEIISRFDKQDELTQSLNTIIDYIRFAISECNQHDVYYGHGTQNAWQEAHRLVFTALSLPLDISVQEQQVFYACNVTQPEKTLIFSWIKARCEDAIPLPYLSNQAGFAGMPFYIDERALIPRSPFAELIENRFVGYLANTAQPGLILDMCTGSGCIAIALARQFAQAQVDAVDIDASALCVASINIEQYQMEDRVFPMQSDLFVNLGQQTYDLIVVNPPYVDAQDMHDLPREYMHEPESALASGDDGLELTLALLQQAANYMSDDAWLFVEVGNSEMNFAQRFDGFKVHWCELSLGGSGIFAINKSELLAQLPILKKL
ncbi:MAG: ribosomal protein L3 glutamine methyltransferase [Gammaproteobacteria bacterium]|jgi:ribosomal protein L3 glutamine methyltransferase